MRNRLCSASRSVSVLVLVLASGTFCWRFLESTTAAQGTNEIPSAALEDWCARTSRRFVNGVLIKPTESAVANPDSRLAPLILVEHPYGVGLHGKFAPFGALYTYQQRQVYVLGEPTVYRAQSQLQIGHSSFDQSIFLWWYQIGVWGKKSYGCIGEVRNPVISQGICITSDRNGFPLAVEVLGPAGKGKNDGEPQVFFVSASLEQRAKKAFGSPLPGRQFAIERNSDDVPNVIVAGVFEDGPIPLGPDVYLQAGDFGVTNILCRCTAAQVDEIVRTETYTLKSADALTTTDELTYCNAAGIPWAMRVSAPEGPDGPGPTRQLGLEEALRWPP